ncbi:MAG: DUF4230 domain-containing protein [Cyanobacteria bacterium P01_C01_bin.72]
MKTVKPTAKFWQRLLLWSIGGINLIVLMLLFSIWRTGDRALDFVGNLFRVSTTEPSIASSTSIAERMKNIQELSTTVQTIETVVPAAAERKIGDFSLATTKLLYIARGEIRAGVDLEELTPTDIKVTKNKIEITLPPAKILDSKIDVQNSRVYDYNRGFLNLGPDVAPQLQTLAQSKTLVRIVNRACSGDILEQANIRAKESIIQLLGATGAKDIIVKTTEPKSCKFTE